MIHGIISQNGNCVVSLNKALSKGIIESFVKNNKSVTLILNPEKVNKTCKSVLWIKNKKTLIYFNETGDLITGIYKDGGISFTRAILFQRWGTLPLRIGSKSLVVVRVNRKDNVNSKILIHITDTHLGGIYVHNANRIESILTLIFDKYSTFKHATIIVLHTGDFVSFASKKSYSKCREIFERFFKRMKSALDKRFFFFITIGNHDLGSGYIITDKNYEKFKNCFQGICDNGSLFFSGNCRSFEHVSTNCKVILLNSMEARDNNIMSDGNLGQSQLKWLSNELRTSNDNSVIIGLHHHPFPATNRRGIAIQLITVGYNSTHLNALDDSLSFEKVLRKYKNKLRGVFFGHRHWREGCVIKGINDHDKHSPVLWSSGSTTIGTRLIPDENKVIDVFTFNLSSKMVVHDAWKLVMPFNTIVTSNYVNVYSN